MNKKILTAVGIVFALVFVGLLSLIFTYVAKNADDVQSGLDNNQLTLESMNLSQYDKTIVNGIQVKNAIDNLKMHKNIKLGIGVLSINPTNGVKKFVIYGYDVVKDTGAYELAAGYTTSYGAKLSTDYRNYKITDREYILDDYRYESELIKAGTGTIVGIEFKQIKDT